jgi:hypothetical protein
MTNWSSAYEEFDSAQNGALAKERVGEVQYLLVVSSHFCVFADEGEPCSRSVDQRVSRPWLQVQNGIDPYDYVTEWLVPTYQKACVAFC